MQDGAEATAAEPCHLLVNSPKGLIVWQSACAIDSPSRPSFIHERGWQTKISEGGECHFWDRKASPGWLAGGLICLIWTFDFSPMKRAKICKFLVAEKETLR